MTHSKVSGRQAREDKNESQKTKHDKTLNENGRHGNLGSKTPQKEVKKTRSRRNRA